MKMMDRKPRRVEGHSRGSDLLMYLYTVQLAQHLDIFQKRCWSYLELNTWLRCLPGSLVLGHYRRLLRRSMVRRRQSCSRSWPYRWNTASALDRFSDPEQNLTFAIAMQLENIIGAIQCTWCFGPRLVHAKPKRPIVKSGATNTIVSLTGKQK
jgi:hypothetical protein